MILHLYHAATLAADQELRRVGVAHAVGIDRAAGDAADERDSRSTRWISPCSNRNSRVRYTVGGAALRRVCRSRSSRS